MMFKAQFHAGIVSGAITSTFRFWKRPQAKSGGVQMISTIGHIEVTDVRKVKASRVTNDDAMRAGFSSRKEMFDYLAEFATEDRDLYRVDFRYAGHREDRDPDRSAVTTNEEIEALEKALDLRDRNSKRGAWTRATLKLIAGNPGMASATMSKRLKCDQTVLKQNVRKLKKLGLTISLETGYELSPKGESYAAHRGWI